MKLVQGLAIGAIALSLAACDQSMYGNGGGINKQTVGTVGGAVAGGLAGSQIGSGSGQLWATGAGVLLGAFLGGEIGKSLDRADRQAMGQTTYSALESGQSNQAVRWQNPDTGHYGTVTPYPAYQQGNYNCREYTQTVYIDGRSETARGTACRQPDGSWQIQN